MKIQSIKAWEILDSRSQPTVAAAVYLDNGIIGTASVPAGASTGSHEAHELRDNDPARFAGQGVLTAVANVEKIAARLRGCEVADQTAVDQAMIDLDGTPDKSALGANAILAVSMATAAAAAQAAGQPLYVYLRQFNQQAGAKFILPIPLMNIMNGGRHAAWATDFQEYMILPVGLPTFSEAVRAGSEIYTALRKILLAEKYAVTVGDEGGFAPAVGSNEEPLQLISQAVTQAGYQLGKQIVFGLDVAASEFFQDSRYQLKKPTAVLNGAELAVVYQDLMKKYPLASLEDPFAEDDWDNFAALTKCCPKQQIIGDDLYATNLARLEQGLATKATNAILIKLNQIGTVSETIAVINRAHAVGWSTIISHRSGETEDTFIADLAVAMDAGQIKTGAPARGERTAKYNRLLAIAAELGDKAEYAKWTR